jgi:hypothetical protein
MVARARGVKFEQQDLGDGIRRLFPAGATERRAGQALRDVTRWLGFLYVNAYLEALQARGRRIFRKVNGRAARA